MCFHLFIQRFCLKFRMICNNLSISQKWPEKAHTNLGITWYFLQFFFLRVIWSNKPRHLLLCIPSKAITTHSHTHASWGGADDPRRSYNPPFVLRAWKPPVLLADAWRPPPREATTEVCPVREKLHVHKIVRNNTRQFKRASLPGFWCR